MRNDLLTKHLNDIDFLHFAIDHNNLITDPEDKKATELGVLLGNIYEKPGDRPALQYLFSIQEFTDILLETLKNYRSYDMFRRILSSLPKNQLAYRLGSLDCYYTPSDFTAVFYSNRLHGLEGLSLVGRALPGILVEWNNLSSGTVLGVYYYVNIQTGGLIVEVQCGVVKSDPDKSGSYVFRPIKVLYTVTLNESTTLEYLDYKYPKSSLFDIFGVSFDKILTK